MADVERGMDKNQPGKKATKEPQNRDDRLKAALKVNLSRRKAQLRARTSDQAEKDKG